MMSNKIIIDMNVPMEMRDGIVLCGDVYRLSDRQKSSAILVRTPYGKLQQDSDYLKFIDAVLAGYAVVVQDVRGRFASEGEFRFHDDVEGPDGYDSVEWIASQTWCDGNVGMMGASYMGQMQWMSAMENPPHLKAISPWICPAWLPGHDEPRLAGVQLILQTTLWIATQGFDVINKLEKEGKDVSEIRQLLNRANSNPEILYSVLPLKNIPLARFEGIREIWQKFMWDDLPGPKLAGKTHWAYDKVMVPCYHTGSWYDYFTWGVFDNFFGMKKEGGSPLARENQYLLIGPWAHSNLLPNFLGDINLGPYARGLHVSGNNLAFFDKYLRGKDIKLPAVRYFVMGLNIWREADVWPLPQTHWQRFFLHSKGGANTANGDGLLTRAEPGSELPDIFVYNPHRPVPTTGGRGVSAARYIAGPIDQSHIEKRSDILCYTTPELEKDTEITGPLELHLFAATSARDTDFIAKLIDVCPDGRAFNVTDGVIRACYRKSILQPELVTPGEVNEYIINMAHTSQLFRKGHRIRIDITSSNFPYLDRNMNTGNPIGEDAQGIPATQTIYHQPKYASYIDLPVQVKP